MDIQILLAFCASIDLLPGLPRGHDRPASNPDQGGCSVHEKEREDLSALLRLAPEGPLDPFGSILGLFGQVNHGESW